VPCLFRAIASAHALRHTVWLDDEHVAFLDSGPVTPGTSCSGRVRQDGYGSGVAGEAA
jgi:hypothetical protein